jgi:hypothetical protein
MWKGKEKMKKILFALLILFTAAGLAVADTIYLKDGRTINGTVLGFVNGRFVVRVEPRYSNNPSNNAEPGVARNRGNEGELQYFRADEVDRIEIEGRSIQDSRRESKTVEVNLESNWVDTGVDLRRGARVQINATGVIMAGRSRITPDGLRSTDPNAPLPQAAEGKLIGAISDDPRAQIFEIGSSQEFTADRSGRLYLTANRSSYNDARGNFSVTIQSERATGTAGDYPRGGGIRSRNRQSNDDRYRSQDRSQERTITVPATSRGTDTGIDVRAGAQITISAEGTIVAGRRTGEVGPEGTSTSGLSAVVNARPVPSAGTGALIGYIRGADGQMSAAYLIGRQLNTTVPSDGRLILAINDDNYSDNSGNFTVRIRY